MKNFAPYKNQQPDFLTFRQFYILTKYNQMMHRKQISMRPSLFLLIALLVLHLPQHIQAQDRFFRWWQRDKDIREPADTIITSFTPRGAALELVFIRGDAHNHPLMAVWLEDLDSNYIQTLYVAESIGKGVFRHGDPSSGRWQPGPVRRPAALPYWGHQRGVQADDGYYIPTRDNPVPDALTGATPKNSFILRSHAHGNDIRQFRVLFEINQSWNWNEYWTNDKFPGDEHYMTSSQPAVVYEARIDLDDGQDQYELKPIGHSHWSGQDGRLFRNLSTITTALEIAETITLQIID